MASMGTNQLLMLIVSWEIVCLFTLSHGLQVKAEAVLDYGEKLFLLSELDSFLINLDLEVYPESQTSVFLRTTDLTIPLYSVWLLW